VQDDVPEWIDKGFVINEKQVAYESKNLKKRKICVSRKRWNTKGKRAREREMEMEMECADIFVNCRALNFDVSWQLCSWSGCTFSCSAVQLPLDQR